MIPAYLLERCATDESVCSRCYRIRKTAMMRIAIGGDAVCPICISDGRGHGVGERPMVHVPARLAMSETMLSPKFVREPFTFHPTDKIFLSTSHKPQARTDDRGIWRAFSSKPYFVQLRVGTMIIRLAAYLMVEWS